MGRCGEWDAGGRGPVSRQICRNPDLWGKRNPNMSCSGNTRKSTPADRGVVGGHFACEDVVGIDFSVITRRMWIWWNSYLERLEEQSILRRAPWTDKTSLGKTQLRTQLSNLLTCCIRCMATFSCAWVTGIYAGLTRSIISMMGSLKLFSASNEHFSNRTKYRRGRPSVLQYNYCSKRHQWLQGSKFLRILSPCLVHQSRPFFNNTLTARWISACLVAAIRVLVKTWPRNPRSLFVRRLNEEARSLIERIWMLKIGKEFLRQRKFIMELNIQWEREPNFRDNSMRAYLRRKSLPVRMEYKHVSGGT